MHPSADSREHVYRYLVNRALIHSSSLHTTSFQIQNFGQVSHSCDPTWVFDTDYVGIKEYSDWPTIPQLYVDKEFVGGLDIVMQMLKDGSLAQLLSDKDVLVLEEEESQKS